MYVCPGRSREFKRRKTTNCSFHSNEIMYDRYRTCKESFCCHFSQANGSRRRTGNGNEHKEGRGNEIDIDNDVNNNDDDNEDSKDDG